MSILLTDQERDRFVRYLDAEIKSSGSIIEQAEKIKVPKVLMDSYRRDIVAMMIVMDRLKSVEVITLTGPG